MQDRYFTDEELVAYLDGENDLAPAAEIAQMLRSDAALGRRLDALYIDRTAIAQSFSGLVPDPDVMPDLSQAAPSPARFGAGALAFAAGLALLAGFGSGLWFSGPSRTGWTDYVAAYQALYSNGTLLHIDQDKEALQVELDRVSASIGKQIAVENLEGFPEATYKRAQVLSFEGRALIQLAFATSTGEPLALCIIRSDGVSPADPQVERLEGLSAAQWSRGGYEYLLIGGTDDALVSRLASGFVSMDL